MGVERECVGEGEGDPVGTIHSGAKQTDHSGWRCSVHPNHQQHHGVRLSVYLQLHSMEFIWTWDHDHHAGGDW